MNKHSFNKLIIIYSDFLLLLYNKILLLPFYNNIFYYWLHIIYRKDNIKFIYKFIFYNNNDEKIIDIELISKK